MDKNVLLTGASGGFGKLTALKLLKDGHNVIASMRNPQGRNQEVAGELRNAGAEIVEIDVTDDKSVEQGVQKAIASAGKLDVVINNAGMGVIGFQEFYTIDDWKNLFDLNVFGVQRINRAVIPHMRQNGDGLLIFISSLLGRITVPFYGPYNASKWALEAMAENYRVELSAFGIESVIVEPGGYPTTFLPNLMKPSDTNRTAEYGDYANAPMGMLEGFEGALKSNPAQKPQDVANAIAGLIEKPKGEKPFRTVVDNMGMGDAIDPYNQQLEGITKGIFTSFGIEGMLSVKKD